MDVRLLWLHAFVLWLASIEPRKSARRRLLDSRARDA
jgi:hypothetical protein